MSNSAPKLENVACLSARSEAPIVMACCTRAGEDDVGVLRLVTCRSHYHYAGRDSLACRPIRARASRRHRETC